MSMSLTIALLVGLAAGLHTSTWGMYKDSPHEGFTWPKYFRSTILAGLCAVAIAVLVPMNLTRAADLVVLFGVTYVTERALTEYYKTFLREEDQSKYTIPMQVAVLGNVVQSRTHRWLMGFGYLAAVTAVVVGLVALQRAELGLSEVAVVLIVGSVGGWISAFGGAWKDAPVEGFETLKFFRSPAIALAYAFLLANFTTSYLFIAMGALGYTIATIETYKTFFFPSKPRGKFADKPVLYPEMLEKRKRFVPLYAGIWVAILVATVLGFAGEHQGLL